MHTREQGIRARGTGFAPGDQNSRPGAQNACPEASMGGSGLPRGVSGSAPGPPSVCTPIVPKTYDFRMLVNGFEAPEQTS